MTAVNHHTSEHLTSEGFVRHAKKAYVAAMATSYQALMALAEDDSLPATTAFITPGQEAEVLGGLVRCAAGSSNAARIPR